jgi:uncharacterized protein YabN with tetrapyrrole methylase and pyrophosphatase domain
VVADLPKTCRLQGFDAVYERGASFSDVYAEIAARVLVLGNRPEGVVYAVPGHPLVGEATVTRAAVRLERACFSCRKRSARYSFGVVAVFA